MLMNRFITLFLLSTGIAFAQERAWTEEEETTEYWYEQGRIELKEALRRQDLNKNVARNVILFLGDGMGIPSITAGRILKGQLKNASGEETVLAMDQFPHAGLSKTYAVDKDVTDSAASATAYLCGVKTNYHTIGVSGMTSVGNCASSVGNHVDSVLVDAYKAGKSTGIVTTAHITHATPAGTYAHVADRDWYADDDLTEEAKANGCKDIARQFYEESDKITVGLGGGRKYFMLEDQVDPEYPRDTPNREDGLDLIQMWKDKHGENAKYVWNATAFNDVNPITTDKLFGLFEPSHMQYEADRALDPAGEPSIAEMTEKAIRILQKNTKGFFLLVEGGRIDHGHHATNAHRALRELVAMDEAIEKAVELTAESDTLIVVTADHSHTFNMGGYSVRGNPILGLAPDQNDPEMALDDKPYTTLLYGNGPGYQGSSGAVKNQRTNLTEVDTQAKSYMQQTSGPKESETHGGEDVAILARGPMAHLFHGVHEESYIAYVMRYASCTGDNQGHCSGDDDDDDVMPATEGASGLIVATFVGMELNREQAAIALNSQFVILLCLLLFWVLWFIVICQRARNRCRRKGCSLVSTPQLEMKTAYENNID